MADMSNVDLNFMPPLWMRPAMVQTGLASLKFRKRGKTDLENNSRAEIITTPDGVRLKTVVSEGGNELRPVFIFIHGWEGSSESTYVVASARRVYDKACGVVRLNLRDHGESHGLNEGAFYATLFDEVFDAVKIICGKHPDRQIILAGFSLGGNFTLRVARQLIKTPIDNLSHLIAISPVIDPPSSNPSLDNNAVIRAYFLKKWKRSLALKQAAFPEIYNFDDIMGMTDIMKMTNILIPQHTDYPDAMTYFKDYAIAKGDVKDCPIPLTIIAAEDDPVVPMDLCKTLELGAKGRLFIWPNGGHNGFFQSLMGPTGYDDVIADILEGY